MLIIIHEGGHYLAARAFGMRVLRYSIGFGPTLVRYQPKGSPTVFQIAVIPFLAYVQIAGMNPNEEVDPDDPGLFPNKSLFARVTTIAAGPVANYLTASAIVFALGITNTLPPMQPVEPMQVGHVVPDSPAAQAGIRGGWIEAEIEGESILLGGDVILAVDGVQLRGESQYPAMRRYLASKADDQPVILSVFRGGDVLDLALER